MAKSTKEYLLLTAGPVPLSQAVKSILSRAMTYHRSREFIEAFDRLTANLQYLLQTTSQVYTLTASGSGGMEAAIVNFFSPGDAVLIVENGKFSERWSHIARSFQLQVNRLSLPWGQSPSAEIISRHLLSLPQQKGIFLTHCETSTGALTNLQTIVPQIRELSFALIVVDVISSAAILPLKVDEWGIDVAVCASQKGLGLPPGLAMLSVNEKAWQFAEHATLPKFYFDIKQVRQSLSSGKGAAFTPAIPLILAADFALQQIREQGLEKIWRQRHELAANFRSKIAKMDLSIFPLHPADALTVIKTDFFQGSEKLKAKLKEQFAIIVSGGQGQLVNKVIRIGHMANVENKDLTKFLEALQIILNNK